jgi:branched-chain amino acid transport system ATP-binding protein
MSISDNSILLKVEKLNIGYGKQQVLFDTSFEVKRGVITLFIGGNGSGKSTVLKAIYGLLNDFTNRSGSIFFSDEDITNCKPFQLVEKGLVYVPQKNNTFEQLSVLENLEVAANILNKELFANRIKDVFEKLPILTTLKNRIPFQLSGGEKQILALGMALIHLPKMILLDEPGAGLAPIIWQNNLEIIKSLNQKGITFLIVEHRVKETLEKADNILQMKLGKVINKIIKTNLYE